MAIQRKSLGRGLGSIISAGAKKAADSGAKKIGAQPVPSPAPLKLQISAHGLFSEIPIDKVAPSPYQARKEFSELLAGERRLRACRLLGMKKIVACVQNASDSSAAAKGLIENIQRADLNPMEEARGIAYLIATFRLTQDAVSQRLGKPRSSIANSLRLLRLPESVQGYISSGMISPGHAKVILSVEDKTQQEILARRIIENGLNVRGAEDAVRRLKDGEARADSSTPTAKVAQSAVVRDIQNKISTRLNASVEVRHGSKKGKIIIEYLGNDDLQRILEIIGVKI